MAESSGLDTAASITRNGTTSTFARDPQGRRLTVTSSGTNAVGTETKHYADSSDNPAWTSRVQGTETITTRYESTIGGDLALTITGTKVELAVNNPHGDVVATVPITGTGSGQGITGWAQYDEYGNPLSEPVRTGATTYGWHGADERAVDTSGLILMGVRLFNPTTGLFTSRDPAPGGNTTSYVYPQDPVGMNDTTGMWSWRSAWSNVKSHARRSWSNVKRAAGRVGNFAAKHWRNGNIARVAGGIAFGACVVASAGVCAGVGIAAAGVSIAKRVSVDYHDYRRQKLSRSKSWGRVIRGSLVDIGFTFLAALRGAKVLRGRHRAGAYAPKLKRRWIMPKNRWAKRAVIGGYGAGLWWSVR